jgi:ribosomal protein S14
LQLQIPHQGKLQNNKLYHKKIKNTCILTGHSKNILKDYKITRFALKQLHKNHNLPGITNAT